MATPKIPKSLLYPVYKKPAEEVFGEGFSFSNKLSHFVITDTDDGPRIVNACSKNYTILENKDILTPILTGLGEKFELELRAKSKQSSKFYVDLIIKDKALKVTKKDDIFPRVRFMNSYDGSLKYSFMFGFYRVVCSNGLTIPAKDIRATSVKIMHTPSAVDRWEKVIDTVSEFFEESSHLISSYQELAGNKLTLDEAIGRLNDVLKNTKAPKTRLDAMVNQLQKEKNAGLPVSDWLVYNAVNHELNHGGLATAPHKLDKVDQEVLQFLLK